MSESRRRVSILISIDGSLKSTTYRLPLWVLRTAVGAGVALAVLLVAALAFYGPIARAAARVPGLQREVERLSLDRDRVRELAQALDSVEANYARLRQMVGADVVPDPVQLGSSAPVAPAIVVTAAGLHPTYESGPTLPRHWPLDERGYVTRGQVAGNAASSGSEEAHPGIDIAVPVGALVRAAGGGTVLQAGEGGEYGRFVLLQHPDGYQTLYGHLSRLTVVEGQRLEAGQVLGRSGNTGRSSAPHLHFEVRRNGVSIDPMTMVKEGR